MIKLTGIRTYYYTDKMEHVHFIKHLTRVHAVDGVGNARAIGSPCTLCELLQVGETRALFHCRAVPANALPSVAASGRPARSPRRRRRPRRCRLRWSSAEAGPPSPSLTEQALSLEPAGLIERRDRGRRVGGGA
jgi:hypothetical protein